MLTLKQIALKSQVEVNKTSEKRLLAGKQPQLDNRCTSLGKNKMFVLFLLMVKNETCTGENKQLENQHKACLTLMTQKSGVFCKAQRQVGVVHTN